jgi:hypothetical protein
LGNQSNILFNSECIIQKFDGKGGWHYVELPNLPPLEIKAFGMCRVKGSIDNLTIKDKTIMPMGNGKMMLNLDNKIRSYLKKSVGDTIFVILEKDDTPFIIPNELEICLKDVPPCWDKFLTISKANQRQYVKQIYQSKNPETIAKRIERLIERLS